MKSLQIAAIRHMPWLEDRHTLSDGRVCIRLTTAANEFDAVTLRHADHYAEGEPFARATDTPMERMWRDENHEVWQAVFRPHDPRIVYAFILRAGDVTLLHDADVSRRVALDNVFRLRAATDKAHRTDKREQSYERRDNLYKQLCLYVFSHSFLLFLAIDSHFSLSPRFIKRSHSSRILLR